MVKIYTSTVKYEGRGSLNITAKSGGPHGSVFAPSWDLIRFFQNTGDQDVYKKNYALLMERSKQMYWGYWQHILDSEEIVFCCYCKPGVFCHRLLLAQMFMNLGAEYCGEIK